MIIQMAPGRGWRIESDRTLGYGEQGGVKSRCKGVLLRNSGRNSGVRAFGMDAGRTGRVLTLELNSGRTGRTGRSEGGSDACIFFADVLELYTVNRWVCVDLNIQWSIV